MRVTGLVTDEQMHLSLHELCRSFPGPVSALEGIDLEVPAGQFLAILGPSGCGKSTLLRLIAGLDAPTAGSIRRTSPRGHRIGFVFQDAHLLPWRNVLQNVALPLELSGMDRQQRLEQAEAILAQVGLGDALGRYPNQLSGGMRMRVSLARALVTEPDLLLLDEPFAALDEITRQRLDEQLRQLWQRRGLTVIFVTHSIAEATFLAERAVVMSPRPGRILLDRAIDLPAERPAAIRTDPAFAFQMQTLFSALRQGGER